MYERSMTVKRWCNDTDSEGNSASGISSTSNPTWTCLGLNPDLRSEELATNQQTNTQNDYVICGQQWHYAHDKMKTENLSQLSV
jgi:hypothetical protein